MGIELAASLAWFARDVAFRHLKPHRGIHITLVEAQDRLLPHFEPGFGLRAKRYLSKLGITIRLKTHLTWDRYQKARLNGQKVPAETVIWAAGVTPHALIQSMTGLRQDTHGRVLVDASIGAIDVPGVWAAGDCAAVFDAGVMSSAVAHGRHLARAIDARRHGRLAPPYFPLRREFILQLGPRDGIGLVHGQYVEGILAIVHKRIHELRYFLSILPLGSAMRTFISRGEVVEEGERLGYRPSGRRQKVRS